MSPSKTHTTWDGKLGMASRASLTQHFSRHIKMNGFEVAKTLIDLDRKMSEFYTRGPGQRSIDYDRFRRKFHFFPRRHWDHLSSLLLL